MSLITPHGAVSLTPLIATGQRLADLEAESSTLPSITVSSAAAANAVMLGAGYFTPLTGYMNRADALSVATDLKTTDDIFWPVRTGQKISSVVFKSVATLNASARFM